MSQLRRQGEGISQFISTKGEEDSMDITLEPKSTHGAITKAVVPVRLYQDGGEQLVCRSQAKRLLARVDKFKVVILDFADVDMIGQAFADEVFRVFRNQHPEIELLSINETHDVKQMMRRAESY